MKSSSIVLLLLMFAAPAHALSGRWITASGNLEIEIAPCGDALCGTAVQVLNNRSMSDPSVQMADRPALGLKILRDFMADGDNHWRGYIYDRENGKTYRCRMTLLSEDQLSVRPYIGLPLFGQTQIWRRALDLGDQK
jgi:uncharacterized protein (DUF2147 family)